MTSKAFGLAQLGNAYADGALSNRNKIINGAMTIDQRNAGAAVVNGGFVVDRFQTILTAITSLTSSSQRVTDVPAGSGFNNSYRVTVTSAATAYGSGGRFGLLQRIEGFNTADLMFGTASASPVTLSFWVRASVTGTYSVGLLNNDSTRAYPATYTINTANTWEYKTITVPGETTGTWLTDNGRGIQLEFCLGADSSRLGTANAWNSAFVVGATGTTLLSNTLNATWQITGVQLEAGDTATPFEHRSYGAELALCQRYLPSTFLRTANNQISVAQALSSTIAVAVIPWNVTPRVPPTGISTSAASGFYITNANANTAFTASVLAFELSSNVAGTIRVTHANNAASAGNMVGFYSNTSGAAILWNGCEL